MGGRQNGQRRIDDAEGGVEVSAELGHRRRKKGFKKKLRPVAVLK